MATKTKRRKPIIVMDTIGIKGVGKSYSFMKKYYKTKVYTYVQGANESGKEFSESINIILSKLERENAESFEFHFTTSSDGRQTVNIVYKTIIIPKTRKRK